MSWLGTDTGQSAAASCGR